MDQEIKELLEKNLALSQENNHMLRGIRFTNRLHLIWTVFYLAFIIGGLVVAFNFLAPYLEQAQNTYDSLLETNTKVTSGFDSVKGFFGGNKE